MVLAFFTGQQAIAQTLPTAVCQDITVDLDASGNATITAAQVDGGSFDPDGGPVTLAVSPATFDCSNLGANTVTLFVTDPDGISSCTATVTVNDVTPPVASCVAPFSVSLDGTGNASIAVGDIDAGSTDECGIASTTIDVSSFTCADLGPNTVTLTVTDNGGNVSTCQVVVTVEDNEAPAITCPGPQTLDITDPASCDVALPDYTGLATATDNCSAVVTQSPAPGTIVSGHGTVTTVTLTATDPAGNSTNCTFDVTNSDVVAPTAVCQDITVQLDANGDASIVAADIDNGSSDNCAIVSTTIDIDTFDCTNVGANTVTLTVTDENGNTDSCTATVTVEDNVAPDAVCQDITVTLDPATQLATITPADVDGGSSDACGIASTTIDIDTFTCADLGANNVTLTVTDVNGNVSTCVAVVTVTEDVAPSITCPADVITNNDPGVCTAQVAFADAIAIDLCSGVASVVQTAGLPSGSDFPVGTNLIEFTATDNDGNVAVCSFTITVIDAEAPTITCGDAITQDNDPGVCGANVTVPAPTLTDNCTTMSAPVVQGPFTPFVDNGSGGLADTVSSISGLSNSIGGDVIVSLNYNGDFGASFESFDLQGPDGSQVYFSNSQTGGDCAGYSDTFSIAEATWNSWITTFGTTLDFTLLANSGVNFCDPSQRFFELSFALGSGATLTNDYNGTADASDFYPVGTTTVTWTFTDVGGNSVTCTQDVTVNDMEAPVISCVGEPGTANIVEDFDAGLPADWSTVVNTGDCDWLNIADLPTGDDFATPGMVFDDDDCGSGAPASNATLFSAIYDMTGTTTATLGFDVAFQEISGGETFTVEAWDGAAWQQIAFYDTDLDPDIQTESIDVTSLANAAFQVRFTYDDGGGTWGWHGGIDNFTLDYEIPGGTPFDVFLDANGVATVNAGDLVQSVSDNCGSVTISAGGGGGDPFTLETTFAGGNGFDANWFDIVAINEVTINSFDVNLDTGVSGDVEVYFRAGPYAGFELDPAAWTLAGTANVTSAGDGLPTPLNLSLGITIPAGETYAFYVASVAGGMNYTNGGTAGDVFASDDNIEFLEGAGGGYPFGPALFSPRVFNGNIRYVTGSSSGATIEFDCDDLGEQLVTVTAIDAAGNESSCTATVNVIDNIAPVLVCQDVTLEIGPDGTVEVDPEDLLGTAPATFNVITISSDNGSGTTGTTDLTVPVTEAAVVSFDWDYTTPDGAAFDSFGYVLNGVYTELTDPAGGLTQSGNSGPINVAPGDVFGFRSQSEDGLFGPCTTTVSNFLPGFTGQFEPANWTETLVNSDGSATFIEIPAGPLSFDNCGITILAVDINEFSCDDIANSPFTVTVFGSDSSLNTAACQSEVTVVDALAPEVTCPADQSVDPGPGNLFYVLPDYWAEGDATATDNCTDPLDTFTQDPAPGTELPDGVYTITLCSVDEYGNEGCCTFELTVESILGNDDNELSAAISMYPNPASDVLNFVNGSNIALETAKIFDMNGKLINTIDLRDMQTQMSVDVSYLASGVYMVQITGERSTTMKRLLKE